jgi:hypothetical protein
VVQPVGQDTHALVPPIEYSLVKHLVQVFSIKPYPLLHVIQTEELEQVVQPIGQDTHALVPPIEYSLVKHLVQVFSIKPYPL